MRLLAAAVLALPLCAQTGAESFELHCRRCHAIEGRGGSVGPDLGWIALTRTAQQLRTALVDPSAEIVGEFATARVAAVDGIVLNEDDLSIQLRLADGSMRSFPRQGTVRTGRSLMPAFSSLPARELDALAAYLATLRGGAIEARPRTRKPAPLAESQAWMTRPSREAEEKPEEVLDAVGIGPGDAVADVGAGSGFFTWRLARRAARVVAVDSQENVLRQNADTTRIHGDFARVTYAPALPPGTFQVILVANAYHEFAEPEAMLAAIRKALAPGGRLCVIEYKKEKPGIPVGESHKMSLLDLRTEIEPEGFRLERILDFLPLQHGLIFTAR
ncbi:MAG: methyltransferase domain-containing protein [Bryobacteraceae bacterium]